MKTKLIKGLSQVQSKYDAFFIDLWGVVHNGIYLYPEAIKVLENLNNLNKRIVLMSNAPRPSKSVEKFLLNLKMNKKLIKNIFTSGEVALKSLQKNTYGKNFYHLGPLRDNSLFAGFEENKKKLEDAEFILCTGFLDNDDGSLKYYKQLLKNYTHLTMLCTNPDLIVHRGNKKEYCAGKLAEIFKGLSGKVIYFGKPYPEVYKFCMKTNESVLVVGDNLRTDIKGANNMNLDSLFITHGVHKNEFINVQFENYSEVLKKYNVKANYYQEKLFW